MSPVRKPVREHGAVPGPEDPAIPDIVIITGMSGAGRSTAANALEDLGWFVVDNLPPGLLPTMVDLAERSNGAVPKIAAVVDVRSRAFTTDLKSSIDGLGARGVAPRIVFLEAGDDTLIRRFDNVRRPHPLQADGRVVNGIAAERALLRDVRGEADLVLDTSRLNVHELRGRMRDFFGGRSVKGPRVSIVSFGYKYGLPVDADLVVDCRFLPNPHWIPELAPMTGLDAPVRDYVLQPARRTGVPQGLHRGTADPARGGRAGRQALRDAGRGVHRRQAPQCGDCGASGGTARRRGSVRVRCPGHPPGSRA